MTDFQKIRQEIPIEEVARWLGIEVQNGKARCPFHNDQTPSMSFKDGRFKCFGCDASGDAIDLVARLKHLSTTDAALSITDLSNGDRVAHVLADVADKSGLVSATAAGHDADFVCNGRILILEHARILRRADDVGVCLDKALEHIFYNEVWIVYDTIHGYSFQQVL